MLADYFVKICCRKKEKLSACRIAHNTKRQKKNEILPFFFCLNWFSYAETRLEVSGFLCYFDFRKMAMCYLTGINGNSYSSYMTVSPILNVFSYSARYI